jgi:hypothetical protein
MEKRRLPQAFDLDDETLMITEEPDNKSFPLLSSQFDLMASFRVSPEGKILEEDLSANGRDTDFDLLQRIGKVSYYIRGLYREYNIDDRLGAASLGVKFGAGVAAKFPPAAILTPGLLVKGMAVGGIIGFTFGHVPIRWVSRQVDRFGPDKGPAKHEI